VTTPITIERRTPSVPDRIARRTRWHDARRHFAGGGSVLICEYGDRESFVVTLSTTTHDQTTTTWDALAEQVRMWRGRYPNQRFYIVQAAPAKTETPAPATDPTQYTDFPAAIRAAADRAEADGRPSRARALRQSAAALKGHADQRATGTTTAPRVMLADLLSDLMETAQELGIDWANAYDVARVYASL
jgi:hypothetical protein